MADDKMKNDDLQRNMGGAKDQHYGQQSPRRSGQTGQQGGQHAGGQQGQQGGQQGGQFGGQKGSRNLEDDEDLDTGAGKTGGGQQNRGGMNR